MEESCNVSAYSLKIEDGTYAVIVEAYDIEVALADKFRTKKAADNWIKDNIESVKTTFSGTPSLRVLRKDIPQEGSRISESNDFPPVETVGFSKE